MTASATGDTTLQRGPHEMPAGAPTETPSTGGTASQGRPFAADAPVTVLAILVVGILLALAFWPTWALVPQMGGDASWVLGLSWAAELGLQWGTDVVFTYGPLAYLESPMVFAPAQIVAAGIVHVVATLIALSAAYYLCRARMGLDLTPALLAAAGATGLALYVNLGGALFAALVFTSLVLLVSRSWSTVLVLGIGLGLIGHQKLSEALLVLGFALLCSLGALGLRGVIGLAVVTGLAWLGFWVAAGQALANLVPWIKGAIDISTGHADALSTDLQGGLWHLPVAILLSGLVLWLAWRAGGSLGRRRRYALVTATVWALWLTWNAAFNRHDVGHVSLFFETTIVIIVALTMVGGRGRVSALGLATLALTFLFMNTIVGPFLGPIDREQSLLTAGRAATALSSSAIRQAWLRDTAIDLAGRHEITPELESFLGAEPTLADPGDISAVWAASELHWATASAAPVDHFVHRLPRSHEPGESSGTPKADPASAQLSG